MEHEWLPAVLPVEPVRVCVGTSIENLRSQALARAAAEGVSRVSANDIMSAILWLIRYRL